MYLLPQKYFELTNDSMVVAGARNTRSVTHVWELHVA